MHSDVHCSLVKGKKIHGPFLGASGPKTRGSELGAEVTRQEGKRGGAQAAAATVLQGESLPCVEAQQRPLGWGPREIQATESPKTMGKERPWAPLGCWGVAWCQPSARHRAVLRTKGGRVAGWRG